MKEQRVYYWVKANCVWRKQGDIFYAQIKIGPALYEEEASSISLAKELLAAKLSMDSTVVNLF